MGVLVFGVFKWVGCVVGSMAECPDCGAEHSHSELELVESYSTGDSTYALLECASCGGVFDYSEWDAFARLYD